MPLQILYAFVPVTVGVGFTVTVIVAAVPTHEFAVDVGITIYWTEPTVVRGFVRT